MDVMLISWVLWTVPTMDWIITKCTSTIRSIIKASRLSNQAVRHSPHSPIRTNNCVQVDVEKVVLNRLILKSSSRLCRSNNSKCKGYLIVARAWINFKALLQIFWQAMELLVLRAQLTSKSSRTQLSMKISKRNFFMSIRRWRREAAHLRPMPSRNSSRKAIKCKHS